MSLVLPPPRRRIKIYAPRDAYLRGSLEQTILKVPGRVAVVRRAASPRFILIRARYSPAMFLTREQAMRRRPRVDEGTRAEAACISDSIDL